MTTDPRSALTAPASPRFWWLVVAGLLMALVLAFAGLELAAGRAPTPSVAVAFGVLPAAIVAATLLSRGCRADLLVLASVLVDVETLLVSAIMNTGLEYAVLFPLIGLVLLFEVARGRTLDAAFALAGATSLTAVAIALCAGPASHWPGLNPPIVGIAGSAIFISIGYGYLWRLNRRRSDALEVAAAEIATRSRLQGERERLATAIEQAADVVILTDPAGLIEYANPAFERLTGYRASDIAGRPVASVLRSGIEDEAFYAALDGAFERGEAWAGTIVDRRADGSLFEYDLTISPLRDAGGELAGSVHLGRDRSHERQMEADLALEADVRLALAAALHALPEQATAEQAAQAVCDALWSLPKVCFASIFGFSLDHQITALGHRAPDGFPPVPGQSSSRAAEMHARGKAGPYAEKWEPRDGDGTWGRALTGLGLQAAAYGPIEHAGHVDGMLMLGTCDAAFAQILLERMPAVVDLTSTPSALLAERLHEWRHTVETRAVLERVIDERAFSVVFQPIRELKHRRVVGYEALTRFSSGQRPDLCFADAWSVGLGPELEIATLEAAVDAARELPPARWLDLNVSPRLLAAPDRLRNLLRRADRALVIEITEHEAVGDYGALTAAVRALGHDLRLAVDDAGAGIANFGHIIELHPDFVKLDISLVRRVNANLGRQALVSAMRQFATTAGCRLVAEGIETEEEATTLSAFGVEFGQGYLLGRPAPAGTWAGTADRASGAGDRRSHVRRQDVRRGRPGAPRQLATPEPAPPDVVASTQHTPKA